MIINDIQDRNARFALGYGQQPVKGFLTKHRVKFVGLTKQVSIQQAVGQAAWLDRAANIYRGAGWQGIDKLFYGGEEIGSENYHFHSGGASDAPDPLFPEDKAHPEASYYSTLLPDGMGEEDRPDRALGIFKTLKVPNFNGAGQQIDSNGDLLPGGANPYDYYYYGASPARVVMDLRERARRSPLTVNYPAWVDWRDFCAELINWDDGALTPHQVSLEASAGGSLAPGTYWVRIATLKGGDISSASKDRANDGITTASVVISGGNLQFTVNWASQLERGATGYRVYVGTSEGGQDKFFTVADGATNTLLISTLSGASMGTPPNIATGSLLRQIPRFLAMPFFVPPFDFSTALDRIAQITCMDYHYANGKLVFLTPEIRSHIFELNLSRAHSFRTWQVDRRQKPNMIIGLWRDLDHEFLAEGEPVVVTRPALQAVEGDNALTINFGTAYRSQVERGCHYWARRLIDSDQVLEIVASPKAYHVLPANVVNLTHDVPNWSDIEFMVEEKEEQEDTKAGYQLRGRIYGAWYSDTDTEPLPRPLPEAPLNPFAAPPLVTSVTLSLGTAQQVDGTWGIRIFGGVTFATFVGNQRGRVWVKRPGESDYQRTEIMLFPEPATLQAGFEILGFATGTYRFKVVTESSLGVTSGLAAATEYTVDLNILATQAKIFDNVPPADAYLGQLGLTFGIARASGSGQWFGAEVWRDRGPGYEKIAEVRREAILGHTSNNSISWLGDGSFGSYGILYVQKLSGAAFSNATLAEVNAGKNNYFVGREKLGVRTWTDLGSGLWKGENLVRGLGRTEIYQGTHTAQEDFVHLDDQIAFIPLLLSDVDRTLNFKLVTFGGTLGGATAIPVTIRGDSQKAAAPWPNRAYRSDKDWVFALDDRSLHFERPSEFGVDIVGTSRTLSVKPGIRQAAILIPLSLNTVITKNTMGSTGKGLGPGEGTAAAARSQQLLSGVNFYCEARINPPSGGVFTAGFSLNQVDTGQSHFSIQASTVEWSISENGVIKHSAAESQSGVIWTIAVTGSEVRVFKDKILIYIGSFAAKPPYYVRAGGSYTGSAAAGSVLDIWLANGDVPLTIYAERQQIEDFGSAQKQVSIDAYQKMPYVELPRGHVFSRTYVESLTGMISFWKLDEASGQRVDSISTNHLTDNNTVTQALGKIGMAAQFAAANSESLNVASNAELQAGDISFGLSVDVWLDALGGGIIEKVGEYMLWYTTGSNRFQFRVYRSGVVALNAETQGPAVTGRWYHIEAWHDASADTINIQVNNGTINSLATGGALDAAGAGVFQLGFGSGGIGYLSGRLDNIAFIKGVPTAQERAQRWNEGLGAEWPYAVLPKPITWSDRVNATVQADNSLVFSGFNANWLGGATSIERIGKGEAVRFPLFPLVNLTRAVGLSESGADAGLNSIQFAVWMSGNGAGGGTAQVSELGVNKGSSFAVLNAESIVIAYGHDRVVRYYLESSAGVQTLKYSSLVQPAKALQIDVSAWNNTATIAAPQRIRP